MSESLYYKEAPVQVFSCDWCEIFKNIYFEKYLRTAASEDLSGAAMLFWFLDISRVAACRCSIK